MKKILSIAIFVILLAGVLYFLNLSFKDNTSENITLEENPSYSYVINFTFDNEDKISIEYPYAFSSDKNLLSITQDIATQQNWDFKSQDYGEMGMLVTQIKNKTNGEDQNYWQYFVADKQPLISADKYYPQEGEIIDWKFITSQN